MRILHPLRLLRKLVRELFLGSKSSPDISANIPILASSRSSSKKIAENSPKITESPPKNSDNGQKMSELKNSDVWKSSETVTPRPHRSPEGSFGSRINSPLGINSPRSRKNSPPVSPRSRPGQSPRKNSNPRKESPPLPLSSQSPSRKHCQQNNNKPFGNTSEISAKKDLAKLFTRPFSKSLTKSKDKNIITPLNIPQRTVTYNLEIKEEIIHCENIYEKDRNSASPWYACHPESEIEGGYPPVFQKELQEQEEKMSPMLPSSGSEKRSPRSIRRRSSAPAMPGSGNISVHRGPLKESEALDCSRKADQ